MSSAILEMLVDDIPMSQIPDLEFPCPLASTPALFAMNPAEQDPTTDNEEAELLALYEPLLSSAQFCCSSQPFASQMSTATFPGDATSITHFASTHNGFPYPASAPTLFEMNTPDQHQTIDNAQAEPHLQCEPLFSSAEFSGVSQPFIFQMPNPVFPGDAPPLGDFASTHNEFSAIPIDDSLNPITALDDSEIERRHPLSGPSSANIFRRPGDMWTHPEFPFADSHLNAIKTSAAQPVRTGSHEIGPPPKRYPRS